VAPIDKTTNIRKSSRLAHSVSCVTVPVVFLAALLFQIISIAAYADQTREQCDKCCRGSQQDEYYLEQCKLKCFRNPDHCAEQKGHREAAPAPAEPAPPRAATPQRPRATVAEPAQPPMTVEPRVAEPSIPAQQKPAPRAGFVYPNPLTLVPGKEWEAAGQILTANGVSPQNPKYQAGLNSIESVLIDFARANPTGGKLPTTQLEKIIRQVR
jgi:hypothetical protein